MAVGGCAHISSAISLAVWLVIWFTNILAGNGVCFAFVSFFLGSRTLTHSDDLRGGVMGLMESIGVALPPHDGRPDCRPLWALDAAAGRGRTHCSVHAVYTVLWATVPRIKSLVSE